MGRDVGLARGGAAASGAATGGAASSFGNDALRGRLSFHIGGRKDVRLGGSWPNDVGASRRGTDTGASIVMPPCWYDSGGARRDSGRGALLGGACHDHGRSASLTRGLVRALGSSASLLRLGASVGTAGAVGSAGSVADTGTASGSRAGTAGRDSDGGMALLDGWTIWSRNAWRFCACCSTAALSSSSTEKWKRSRYGASHGWAMTSSSVARFAGSGTSMRRSRERGSAVI